MTIHTPISAAALTAIVPGDALFAALAKGKAIDLTGSTSAGKSTVVIPGDTAAPVDPAVAPSVAPTPGDTTAPDRVQLPGDITGQNAGQRTCTVSNK